MANPQHVKWLNEGVSVWNLKRKLAFPEFSHANFRGANLREANLKGANLFEADLSGAELNRVNLSGALLKNAKVRTTVSLARDENKGFVFNYTDLSKTQFLKQHQLEMLLGDSGTIIPDNLRRPAHWAVDFEEPMDFADFDPHAEDGEFKTQNNQSNSVETTTPRTSQRPALAQHVELILHTLPASSAAGKDAAIRLRQAINLFHNETGQNQSVEGEMIERMASGFDTLSDALEAQETGTLDKDGLIAVLQARLQEQEKLVIALKDQLSNTASTKKQVLVGALGAAGGAGLIGTFSHMFGPDGASLFNSLWNLMTQDGTIAVPPPVAPTTLPPITTL